MTETTVPRPISEYGRSKLEQEAILAAWARDRPRVSTLVGRMANLYGPGQRLDKSQGLISQISRCLLFGVPVHIYVSLDTIRDYVFADDAGRKVVAGLRRLARENPRGGKHVTKVYASEREVPISFVLGIFRHMAKRQLRVISGIHAVRQQQPPLLQFRSRVWADEPQPADIGLVEGVNRLHQHQLVLFQRGRLAPPEAVRFR